MPFSPHWKIGGVFLTGIGALVVGVDPDVHLPVRSTRRSSRVRHSTRTPRSWCRIPTVRGGTSGESRRSLRGEKSRVPGGVHAGRSPRAGAARPSGPGGGGGGHRLVTARRRLRRGRGDDDRQRRRGVGRGRPGAQGQGAGGGGVPPAAQGPGAVHLSAPGRVPGVHRGPAGGGHHRHRLRDGAAARRVPARCWRRCPRWPGAWPPRPAPTTCSATAAAGAC